MKKLTAEENGSLPASPVTLTNEMCKLVSSPHEYDLLSACALTGLTKREAFAMAAMQALAAKTGYRFQDIAADAVIVADRLLAELDRTAKQ